MNDIPLFRIAVSAFIVKAHKLLVLKRGDNESFLPNTWEVPGGGMESGESIQEGVARETKEEAGLDILPGRLFGYFEYLDGEGRSTVNLNFLCQTINEFQDLDLSKGEMAEGRWITLETLDEINFTSLTMKEACKQALTI